MTELQANQMGTCYAIKIKGHLNENWDDWFDGLAIAHEDKYTTTIPGDIADHPLE